MAERAGENYSHTERDWLIEILGRVNGVNVQRPKQRQVIEQIYHREMDAIIGAGWESDESIALRERMADLLTRTAKALKGDPGPLTMHDWSDLPDVAARRATEAGSDAIRTAADGLYLSRPGQHNEGAKDWLHRRANLFDPRTRDTVCEHGNPRAGDCGFCITDRATPPAASGGDDDA